MLSSFLKSDAKGGVDDRFGIKDCERKKVAEKNKRTIKHHANNKI